MIKLPSFFVVGAQKAGTTTLHDWLVQQPDICLPTIKETFYFNDDERYGKGIDWYLSQFPSCNNTSVMGEINPEYMFSERALLRIRKVIPSPKIIFLLRSPIDRAYSHYGMSVRRGYEDLSFVNALLQEKNRLSDDNYFRHLHFSYMTRSRYCEQIFRIKKIFPSSGLLFIKFDELISSERGYAAYKKICTFVGAMSSAATADRSLKSNQASLSRSNYLNALLYGAQRSRVRKVFSLIARPIPSDIKLKIGLLLDRLNQKAINKNIVNGDFIIVPAETVSAAKDEIAALEVLTELDLQNWLTGIERKYQTV